MGGPEVLTSSATEDLNRLQNCLDSIGSFSEGLILHFDVAARLWHYTNLEGALGMLKNDDLWLTHTRYCNDESEMTHGFRLAQEVIGEEQKSATGTRREYLHALGKLLLANEIDPVYICCFCEQPDLLGQWRSYSANATGVSLEFQPAAFQYITGRDCPPHIGLMRFWRVFYPEDTQRKIIRSAINYYPTFEPAATTGDWARWTWEAIRFFLPPSSTTPSSRKRSGA